MVRWRRLEDTINDGVAFREKTVRNPADCLEIPEQVGSALLGERDVALLRIALLWHSDR